LQNIQERPAPHVGLGQTAASQQLTLSIFFPPHSFLFPLMDTGSAQHAHGGRATLILPN